MNRIALKSIFVLAFMVIFSGSCYICSAEQTETKFTAISPQEAVKDMSPGWNLGNTLEAPTEGAWNPPVKEYTFDDIKKAGFRTVRIPVTWYPHMGPAPDYKIAPEWMNRVEEVVDWALKRGFYVIIDVHHDSTDWFSRMAIDSKTGRYINDYDNQIIKLEKLWEQIAKRFQYKSEKLIFDIINEPRTSSGGEKKFEPPKDPKNPEKRYDITTEQMNGTNRRILKIIRSSGGYNNKRLVMICGSGYAGEKLMDILSSLEVPEDKYIMLSGHYYQPWDFLSNWWGRNTWGTDKEKDEVEYVFRRLSEMFVENRLPVVIGEWGTLVRSDKFSKWYYHDYVVKTAYKYGIPCILWDNGSAEFEYFDRQKRVWRDETIKDITVNAGLGISNSFINPVEAYFKIDTDIKEDLTVKLELNGNELLNIYNGENRLSNGKHYVLDAENSTVTIKKSYLAKLLKPNWWDMLRGIPSKNFGVVATLKFDFSKGTDMPLNIIRYDLPKFSEDSIIIDKTKGEIQSDMVIPVSFNGTKLATVGVVDEATKKPVEYPWTSYLMMKHQFDYNDKEIILKKRLLDLLKSDSLITFEFYPKDVKVEMKAKVLSQ